VTDIVPYNCEGRPFLAVAFDIETEDTTSSKVLFVELTETGPGSVTILCSDLRNDHYVTRGIRKLGVYSYEDRIIVTVIDMAGSKLTIFLCNQQLQTQICREASDSSKLLNDVHIAPVFQDSPLIVTCGDDNLIRVYQNYLEDISGNLSSMILQGHRDDVTCVRSYLSKGSKYPYIISGSCDKSIRFNLF
jgi:WD40 repeat protein